MTLEMKSFLGDLELLLKKHQASISFDPRHGDTHGFGDAGIAVTVGETEHLFHYEWSITQRDVREALTD